MFMLIAGLIVFLGVHSAQIFGLKGGLVARLGANGYKGAYSVASLVGLVLIVMGYGAARAEGSMQLYNPPAFLHPVTLILMMIAMVLLATMKIPGRIQAAVKHPMLAAIKVWALAHLLSNGDLASVLLFGSFLAWAVIDRISVKRRPVDVIALEKARAAPVFNDLIAVVIGATLYVVFALWLHPILFGVPVM